MKSKAGQKAVQEGWNGVSIRAERTVDGWVSRIPVCQPLAPLSSKLPFSRFCVKELASAEFLDLLGQYPSRVFFLLTHCCEVKCTPVYK
jgi:hypothetical protein